MNSEIYAGSPSYLITAGGSPADFAIDPRILGIAFGSNDQQLGVAVTTSFMPTGIDVVPSDNPNAAGDLIQFGEFSQDPGGVDNYGVAPDFACGHRMFAPFWCVHPPNGDKDVMGSFRFVDFGSDGTGPGFFLAIYDPGDAGVVLEAFDTWLHPRALKFDQFKKNVVQLNGNLGALLNKEAEYITQNGNRIRFVIWDDHRAAKIGATVLSVVYGAGDPADKIGNAGNVSDHFLNGTILNSDGDGRIDIGNPGLGTSIVLDMTDQAHPRRISETGEVETAGAHQEVWVDFTWSGPHEGDFFHPFNTIADAANAVDDGGVIRLMPGTRRVCLALRRIPNGSECRLLRGA